MKRFRMIPAAAAAVAALAAGGGALIVASAGADEPGPVRATASTPAAVQALTTAEKGSIPAPAASLLRDGPLASYGADLASARQVSAPTAQGGRWFLAPADDGVCLTTTDLTTTCVPTGAVNAGQLQVIEVRSSSLDRDGRPSATQTRWLGVAPDGVTGVRVLSAKTGAVLDEAKVSSNVYAVTANVGPLDAEIQLID